ncbi:MAG: hypothetical protein Q8844_01215 [Pigeon pea little leaf phytoplasma]|nr:hypothetical protein [Pigeon pea little leaf phytoplasma]
MKINNISLNNYSIKIIKNIILKISYNFQQFNYRKPINLNTLIQKDDN